MSNRLVYLRDKIKNADDRVLIAYAFSKIPWVNEAEIGIVNCKPTFLEGGCVLPADFFAAKHSLSASLSLRQMREIYFSHRSGIQGTCSIDADNNKRVYLTIFPEDVCNFYGGDLLNFDFDADESIRSKFMLSLYSIYDELAAGRENRKGAL